MPELYIGLMSGTSLDGADGVLVDFQPQGLQVRGFASAPMPENLKAELLALNTPGANELHRAALAANALVQLYAALVEELLSTTHTQAKAVRAIGAHGQTVRHRPQAFDGTGYTIQLNQGALLAERTGIDVVADFRSRDLAAGGQGAPLVPPFHQAVFGQSGHATAVLNIGGISNVTLLPAAAQAAVVGFDCGPGNALMDAWCQMHTGAAYDDAGRWAAGGQANAALLTDLLSEPFFGQPHPKSTGRDLFNTPWLVHHLQRHPDISAQDVQATLAELTAQSCARSVLDAMPDCKKLVVCGGGAFNTHLMRRLQDLLGRHCPVCPSDTLRLPAQQVEAAAFAWLARQNILGKTASLPSVTGAQGARILGALYRA